MTSRVAVALLVFLVCIPSLRAVAKESIHIGVFLPMSGNVAAFGRMAWDGIEAAHQMMGTVLGREVKLFLEDSKSDKIEAASAVDRLVKEHQVVGIIGGATSANALSGGAIAEQNGVPMISPSATNPLVTRGKQYVFRACFDDSFQAQVAARQARLAMNAETAAVVVDIAQADYSVGLSNLFLTAFAEMGGKVLVTTYIQTGDQEFVSQLAEVRAAKPEIIYSPNYYTENALFAKQARDTGIKVPILMADGVQVPEFIQIGGNAVEGVYLTGHFNAAAITTKLGKNFAANFKQKHKREIDAFGALGADAYFLLIDAIKRANSSDGSEIAAALANTRTFLGASGTIKIGEDHNTLKNLVINKLENGEFTYVTTVNP